MRLRDFDGLACSDSGNDSRVVNMRSKSIASLENPSFRLFGKISCGVFSKQ